jgi:hypothetical protein
VQAYGVRPRIGEKAGRNTDEKLEHIPELRLPGDALHSIRLRTRESEDLIPIARPDPVQIRRSADRLANFAPLVGLHVIFGLAALVRPRQVAAPGPAANHRARYGKPSGNLREAYQQSLRASLTRTQ